MSNVINIFKNKSPDKGDRLFKIRSSLNKINKLLTDLERKHAYGVTSRGFCPQTELENVQLDGIDLRDHPDYVDAYVSYAEYKDGSELTEEELDYVNDNFNGWIQEMAHSEVFG